MNKFQVFNSPYYEFRARMGKLDNTNTNADIFPSSANSQLPSRVPVHITLMNFQTAQRNQMLILKPPW